MGRTLTNNLGFAFTTEDKDGLPGEDWVALEPNNITSYGATITTVARNPISQDRQGRKGVITDLESAVEFETDLGMSSIQNFIEGFCFAKAVNHDMTFKIASCSGTEYTFADMRTIVASQVPKLKASFLVHARGFSNSANNGLKSIAVDTAVASNNIQVAGLIAEASPPANNELEYAGVCSEDFEIVVANKRATLSTDGDTIDFTKIGLAMGQFAWIGDPKGSSTFIGGYGRAIAISATEIIMDKLDSALVTNPNSASDTICLVLGRFIRNVPVNDDDYIQRAYQFEAAYKGLGADGATNYEYSEGNVANSLGFNLPITEKALLTVGFIGRDTKSPVTPANRKTGASDAVLPNKTESFNTSSDVARLRITDLDEAGLTTDFKSLTMTLANGVTPENVLGTLGAKYLNVANFTVTIEAQLLFTDPKVAEAVRNNTTLTMDFSVKNNDGVIFVDIPALTLGDGSKDFPVDESITINTTATAFRDSALGTSLGISTFPFSPK